MNAGGLSLFKDILEDVFEAAIIGFENGVLGAHVERPLLTDSILEAAVRKACNRLMTKRTKVTTGRGHTSGIRVNDPLSKGLTGPQSHYSPTLPFPLDKCKVHIQYDLYCCQIKQNSDSDNKQTVVRQVQRRRA